MSATMVEKGEIKKKGRTYCVAGEPNDVSYKNNTHIPGSSIHYFSKNVAVWPKWTRCDRRAFALQCRRLHTGFEGTCYEHILLVKSGENYQCIQLKRMLIRGSVPTPNTILQAKNSELLIIVYFTHLRCTIFPNDYICTFLIVWKSYQL